MAVLFYLLRVIARLPIFRGNWGLDDWVMTAAMILIIPETICAYLLNILGLGTDMWLVPFDNITKILQIFYYTELLYLAAVALTKISILLFYLRIFPQPGLRKVIWFTIVLCVVYIIAFVTATALQCIPIRFAWERWDGEHHGKCIDLNADAWCSAAFNIVLDLIVIVLPMREIKNLAMSRRRKFGVMLMFLGGLFITVVSMLRLKYLVEFAHTTNLTWDYLPIGYWSAVESHVGVMVACLPAIRSLLGSLKRKFFPQTATQLSYYEDLSKDSNKKASRKRSHSRIFSSIGRSRADKEDFLQLGEFETKGDVESKGKSSPTQSSFERSLTQAFKWNEDILPFAYSGAQMGQPLGGILVRSEYSVDRTCELGKTPTRSSDQELAYRLGGRI
ncbi:uncharacterized protein M421DRAFT_128424 [Didymella exigua CBS 183.55]|uniref:Rhodopsin domain-containing protein n=1 Tax=Didymella exigua CBS 183.55 TaxID=1150837 RepID=A0A6A5RTU2_9PLEO|nr:uncharacterized protein M421DRAFT_128424 [Didymella exigua CBS 183.55]KAF1929736.1 hypothetical protein M421DRAFT_128424 [Didymella exigua CBS 183.55]